MAVRTTATTVRIPPPHGRPGAVARTVVMTATRITRNAAASEPGARVAPVTIAMGSTPAQPARNATTAAPNHPMTPPMTAGISASRTRNATRSRRRAPTAMSRATSAATSSRTTSARNTAKASRIATPSEPMMSRRPRTRRRAGQRAVDRRDGAYDAVRGIGGGRPRVISSTASRNAAAVQGWIAVDVHRRGPDVRAAGEVEGRRMGDGVDAVDEEHGRAPSAGLVVAAPDRWPRRTALAGRGRRTALPGR